VYSLNHCLAVEHVPGALSDVLEHVDACWMWQVFLQLIVGRLAPRQWPWNACSRGEAEVYAFGSKAVNRTGPDQHLLPCLLLQAQLGPAGV